MACNLEPIDESPSCALYRAGQSGRVSRYVVSTPESRSICNDPLVFGVHYTNLLRDACSKALSSLKENGIINLSEHNCLVLNILRGGLNFGLRDALSKSFRWNKHGSAFISAQRARVSGGSDWIITENDYKKISFPKKEVSIVFGDVVATGTSLEYALNELMKALKESNCTLNSLIFFTIGGARSHEILEHLDKHPISGMKSFESAAVVYLEGIFGVASQDSPLSIKIDGTDLLRRDCLMAPEFIESQYLNPTFPLERCTIYDAGSRAFDIPEYLEDVIEYWEKVSESSTNQSFSELLCERCPDVSSQRFPELQLSELCREHLLRLRVAAS